MLACRLHHVLLVLILVATSTTECATGQETAAAVENVLLVTMDGLRWQELFAGADRRLINREDGGVSEPDQILARYWRDSPAERREVLMPFFWKQIATEGAVWGEPDAEHKVAVTNQQHFSYPGYSEILCGFSDPAIDSNDKRNNTNVTVLEWLHRKPEFAGRVAAFCSWDVFPYIIHTERSGIPVNAGWAPLETFESDEARSAYRKLADTLPRYWQGVRYDAFTFRGAVEYMKVQRPRVLFVALGETDDWAHAGRYDLYLDSAQQNDQMIRELWQTAQSMDQYRGKTALVLTTDHGRGDGRESWKSHSTDIPGCDRIWIAVLAPGISKTGMIKESAAQNQVAATVAALLGEDYARTDAKIGPSLLPVRQPAEQ